MKRSAVESALVDAVREIQTQSGRHLPAILDSTLRPLRDLEDFDSLNCIEVEVLVSERLGQEIAGIPFWDKDAGRALRIGEIVDRLCDTQNTQKRE